LKKLYYADFCKFKVCLTKKSQMKIQLNSDHNIEGTDNLKDHLEETITKGLNRFSEQITRIEVHISDENGAKTGQKDKRCLLEARLRGIDPIAVTHQADTIHQSVTGAVDKMKTALDSRIGKLRNH
jgi:ribosomal subunit interface protein